MPVFSILYNFANICHIYIIQWSQLLTSKGNRKLLREREKEGKQEDEQEQQLGLRKLFQGRLTNVFTP